MPVSKKSNLWYIAALLWLALSYSLSEFPGLESHSGYFGMSYAVIHPESFSGDLTERYHPAMVSVYTLLVKIFGDVWLDDRFNLFVYYLLTLVCFAAIDKLAQVFGITNRWGRLAIISILLVRHMFVDNIAHVIDHICYRPSTYAYPVGLWLAYFLFKGNLKWTVVLSGLLLFTSVKNGWYPIVIAALFIARERFLIPWPRIVAGVGVLAVVTFASYYFYTSAQGKLVENALLFDHSMINTEDSEANPFLDGLGPFFYIPFVLTPLLVRFKDIQLQNRVRALSIISLSIYLLGGIYYTFTPDNFKIPFLLALAVSRSTWWPQLLIFIILAAYLIRRLNEAAPQERWKWAGFLLVLYLFPFLEYVSLRHFFVKKVLYFTPGLFKKLLVLGVAAAGCYAVYQWQKNKKLVPYLILAPFIITTFVIYSFKSYVRRPHLMFLAQHGIMGDSPGAKWEGVNEFFRYETDPKETVMALSGKKLETDTSLRIRTGKTMPLANHAISFYFNYGKRVKLDERKAQGRQFLKDWEACSVERIEQDLIALDSPDYLVVPSANACDVHTIHYRPIREINSFSIYRKMNEPTL